MHDVRRARGAATLIAIVVVASAAPAGAWLERLSIERDTRALVATDRQERRAAAQRLGMQRATELAVDALIAALERETDPEVRAAIVDALARQRDPRAIAALTEDVQRLREEERAARARALAAIDHPLSRRALTAMLDGPAAEIAAARVEELGPAMTAELVALLDLPASAARAASALAAIGDPSATEALLAHASVEDVATRAAVLDALGRAGDERALPALVAASRDPDPRIAIAALRSLGMQRAREASDAIEQALAREDPAVCDAALEALAAVDPTRALPALERALAGPRPEAAWSAMVARPDRAFAALLARAAGDPARRGDAADALGRVAEGAGIAALAGVAAAHGEARAALAVALRRWPAIEPSLRERALSELARESDPERAAWLRAIARDQHAREAILARLASGEAAERATAARSLALLGGADDATREALSRALASELDPLALEVESEAASALGVPAPAPPLEWLGDPERAATALRMLAIAPAPPTRREASERRRAILGALASSSARIRASAVRALARAADRRALTAIAARLEDDAPEVRLAAASALASSGAGARPELASRLAIEPEPAVRRAMRAAIAGAASTGRGESCLHVRVARPQRVAVELVLPDGSWLRDRTLPTGELIVCDLPEAEVDVRLAP